MLKNHALTFLAAGAVSLGGCGDIPDPGDLDYGLSAGVPTSQDEIVGGWDALHNRYPWIASLWDEIALGTDFFFCGGTLIAPRWVLTAAHCPTPDYVKVGPDMDTAARRDVLARYVPAFDPSTMENDIALLELSSTVSATTVTVNIDRGFPSEIPLASASADDANTIVAGWGNTSEGGGQAPTDDLQEVGVPAVTLASCREAYGEAAIHDSNICAGYPQGGKDSCQGDSGGPLLATLFGDIQIGVVSWGYGCARAGLPGVYSRVSDHLTWIESHTPVDKQSPTALILTAVSALL